MKHNKLAHKIQNVWFNGTNVEREWVARALANHLEASWKDIYSSLTNLSVIVTLDKEAERYTQK